MLFLHALLLFLLGITPSMAVVLPLVSRNAEYFREDRYLLEGYWCLQPEVSSFGGSTYLSPSITNLA